MRQILTFLSSLLIVYTVHAANICATVHTFAGSSLRIKNDPIEQWLAWEQKSNYVGYHKFFPTIEVARLAVSDQDVVVQKVGESSAELNEILGSGADIFWYKHPHNTVKTLPYFASKSDQFVLAFYTASRSLVLQHKNHLYSLKMPTDFPSGPYHDQQESKASVNEDIRYGMERSEYIKKIDDQIGEDPELKIAIEVASVKDKVQGEGYILRDLSFMNDGNYYLPAFSIPYVKDQIAQINSEKPVSFWQKNYAALLGRAKAQLFLRYGLQMESPNPQNILLQFDKNLRPTGKIIFRDIGDSDLILRPGQKTKLRPFWDNSSAYFDKAGAVSISKATLKQWGRAHDLAYRETLEQALAINIKSYGDLDDNGPLLEFLKSSVVQSRMELYRQSLALKNTTKKTAAAP